MDIDLVKLKKSAVSKKSEFYKLANKLRNQNPKTLDKIFREEHAKVFSEIDCLECAGCCKSMGPRLNKTDIERLANSLKLKSSVFFEKYINIDEDNDFVFKSMPCPFLDKDNYCIVYLDRPKACKEYPHTNRKNMKGILSLCIKNTEICPAVYKIFIKLEEYFGNK